MAVVVILKHADGTAVTAQEAYDAFMNTRVLSGKEGTTHEAVNMVWYDTNSAQNDPSNVGYVILGYVSNSTGAAQLATQEIGDSSLVPTGQG